MVEQAEPTSFVTVAWATGYNAVLKARELIEAWEAGSPSGFESQLAEMEAAASHARLHANDFKNVLVRGEAAVTAEHCRKVNAGETPII